jgi:hypothetical protein
VNQQDSDRIPENPLRMYNFDKEEEDYLYSSLNSCMLLLSLQLAFTRGLQEDRVQVHTCRPSAGRLYLCVSRKLPSSKSHGKLVWKTRLPASSDLTEKDRQRKTENLIFKLPKNFNKSRNPKEYYPQYGRQFCCWEKHPTD